ncbi:MAG: hypothetical protein AAF583_08090 [Pseudomonadota bacterium]
MTFLVPFLPFVIDFFSAAGAFFSSGVQAQMHTTLGAFFEENAQVLRSLYIGLILFLVAKITFESVAPDYIRRYEDVPDMRKKLMEERRLALEVEERAYAAKLSTRLDTALAAMATEDVTYFYQRTCVSIIFVAALSFLLIPAAIRFGMIFASFVSEFFN